MEIGISTEITSVYNIAIFPCLYQECLLIYQAMHNIRNKRLMKIQSIYLYIFKLCHI